MHSHFHFLLNPRCENPLGGSLVHSYYVFVGLKVGHGTRAGRAEVERGLTAASRSHWLHKRGLYRSYINSRYDTAGGTAVRHLLLASNDHNASNRFTVLKC